MLTKAKEGVKKLQALTDRVESGDGSALPAIRATLERPGLAEETGNLAKEALDLLMASACGQDVARKQGLTRKLEEMRVELLGPDPTAIERLLVERILACWIYLHYLEVMQTKYEPAPLIAGVFFQRLLSAAHKRYLAALKALAVVRRLSRTGHTVSFRDSNGPK